jgi:hypothetical protein
LRQIPLLRFEALASYARTSRAKTGAEEVAWYEHAEGRVLATLNREPVQGGFLGIVFVRNPAQRYRAVDRLPSRPTRRAAEAALRRAMVRASVAEPKAPKRTAKHNAVVDFFAFSRPAPELNPNFMQIAQSEGYSPARQMIEPMLRRHGQSGGDLVAEFQTNCFDRRVWELYLRAMLGELGYRVAAGASAPDFLCSGAPGRFALEVLTVGPEMRQGAPVPLPARDTPEALLAYLRQYMPIRFASALHAKLRKTRWKKLNLAGRPMVYALADCFSPPTLAGTRSALDIYLYGHDQDWKHDADGRLQITLRKVSQHRWGSKVIRSGFFSLPGARNVSAVLFSNGGMLDKFNRMGVVAGFGSGRVLLMQDGTHVNHAPSASGPKRFRRIVNARDYGESWSEGLDVFHNPFARVPLPEQFLPGCAHHHLVEGSRRVSRTPPWHPLASCTRQFFPVDVRGMLRQLAREKKKLG